jgi:hypothetical protein
VGVDDHVERPSWLPEGAAPAVTEEAPAASGQEDAADEKDSLNRMNGAGQQQAAPDPDPPTAVTGTLNGSQESPSLDADADPISYSQDDSYGYEPAGVFDYRQDTPYTPPDYPAAQSGYNDGVSSSVGGESTVPPYPAELPPQQGTAVTKPRLAAAATRAFPKPKQRTPKAPRPPKTQAAQARRANLVIARIEPWSVMKFSFLISLVAWVVLFVAVALLYYALSGLGVFAAIQRTLQSVTSSQGSGGVNLYSWTSASRVLGYTMLLGAVNIILITALSTIGAVIYNLVTHLGGGIEVTLRETD